MGGKTYRYLWKRRLDIASALLLVILLSPILIMTSILVRLKLGSPIIFKQERLGLNG